MRKHALEDQEILLGLGRMTIEIGYLEADLVYRIFRMQGLKISKKRALASLIANRLMFKQKIESFKDLYNIVKGKKDGIFKKLSDINEKRNRYTHSYYYMKKIGNKRVNYGYLASGDKFKNGKFDYSREGQEINPEILNKFIEEIITTKKQLGELD